MSEINSNFYLFWGFSDVNIQRMMVRRLLTIFWNRSIPVGRAILKIYDSAIFKDHFSYN